MPQGKCERVRGLTACMQEADAPPPPPPPLPAAKVRAAAAAVEQAAPAAPAKVATPRVWQGVEQSVFGARNKENESKGYVNRPGTCHPHAIAAVRHASCMHHGQMHGINEVTGPVPSEQAGNRTFVQVQAVPLNCSSCGAVSLPSALKLTLPV